MKNLEEINQIARKSEPISLNGSQHYHIKIQYELFKELIEIIEKNHKDSAEMIEKNHKELIDIIKNNGKNNN